MKKSIVGILIFILLFSTVVGVLTSANSSTKFLDNENSNIGYSHNIIGEFFTYTTCGPCKYAHQALKNLYKGGWHPFYYISMVYDVNKWAKDRHDELGIVASPTLAWDGGFKKDQGASSVISAMNKYNTSIIACGNRNVKDIDLSLDVEWLGAVNPDPEDGKTDVIIEKILDWDVTAMNIDVTVDNNEASQYNGHLHVYVTEVNSTYWDDTGDDPYTFAFLDYAWNEDITVSSSSTWSDFVEWDGAEHNNGKGEYYDEIMQNNAMIIAAVFDEDNNNYTDETIGVYAGVDADPKLFDIYFGNTTPPPKVKSNTSDRDYDPGELEFDTTYYWKIDVWDNEGKKIPGDIWNFTTRGNDPPNTPSNPYPMNNSIDAPINVNLSWTGGDPDWDSVTYDVYFDDSYPPLLVSSNQTSTTYDPTPMGSELEFNKWYYWKIVAWDEYGLVSYGPDWNFRTQINAPPDPPSDPFPENNAKDVPINVTIRWNGTDPNQGDQLKYDVYFDDAFPPWKRTGNQTENWWKAPYDLTLYKTYYWQIVVWDSGELSTIGPIWQFETGVQYPPTAPIIEGPTNGRAGEEYEYTFIATDQNGDDVRYYVDWGDGDNKWFDEYYKEGEVVTLNHTWNKKGTYTIRAKAKDKYNNIGPYGELLVTHPKNKVTYNPSLNNMKQILYKSSLIERLMFFIQQLIKYSINHYSINYI